MFFCIFRRLLFDNEIFQLIKKNNQMNHNRFNKIRNRRRNIL